ncbi:hypothetical protein, partial [Klebsiella aerogenes]
TVTNVTNSNVLTVAGGTASTFSGAITDGSGKTALSLVNANTALTLSGANTYSGGTTVGDGVSASSLIGGAANAFSA